MKRSLIVLAAAAIFASIPALAANSNFGVLLNLGPPVPSVPIEPKTRTPVKILPTPGSSLESGVPYDLIFYDDRYYARQEGTWFSGRHSNGPWQAITWTNLPAPIQHQFEAIRDQRPVVYGEDDSGNRSKGENEGYSIDHGRDK